MIEENSSNQESMKSIDSTNENNNNNNEYSTSINDNIDEKTNTIYPKESDTSITQEKEMTTSIKETEKLTTSKVETEKPTTYKVVTEKPTTYKVETEKPQLDTKETISSIADTKETTTPKVDTNEPMPSKEDTKEQTDFKSDTKESITSKIENTDKPSSHYEYNPQNTSPDTEKTEYVSPKTSIIDNKGQITNIPTTNTIKQSTNTQISENTIEKTTKPSNIEKTSITDNTEKTYTQTPIKENTQNVSSSSSLPEQVTNKPSINKEPEPTTPNQEDIQLTTFSLDKIVPTTNQNNNEVVHTTIYTSLNLTSHSTNLVEKPKSTIIGNVIQKTEEINSPEKTLVILVGVSNIKFGEAIVKFFIHFGLYEIYAGAKRVKILIELSFRIGLRFLEIQEVECDLIENEIKGDMYTYSCEVQTTSNENITNVKIYNQFEFSSLNNSISASCSLLIEQYLENIIEIGNKFDNLLNSTLYILEYPKISQGENQIFNISGIINGLKPKFGKVDLNLSVSAEYENKTEEKLLKCKIIDIIENNYTLSCIGSKNTNISLENAMSVIEDEILMIHFDENPVTVDKVEESLRTLHKFKDELSGYSTLLRYAWLKPLMKPLYFIIGKPIQYCSSQVLESVGGFGGNAEPSVFIDIKSIGGLKGKQKDL